MRTTMATGTCRPRSVRPTKAACLDACQPGPAAATDANCDRRDDDCDGTTDEDYAASATQCGSGACHRQDQTSCVNGSVVDSCQAGVGGASDTSCDGVDDDCDGSLDEDFAGKAESCGQGACERQTVTRCVNGAAASACTPGTASPDNNCNGLDEDCNGTPDDHYAARAVSCGVGVCQRSGATACVGGAEHNACTPGQAGNDAACDGIDNDCNGQIDEDYQAVSETCGAGACRRTVTTSCVGGHETRCVPGPTTGADNDCDGIDDDSNGIADSCVPPEDACGSVTPYCGPTKQDVCTGRTRCTNQPCNCGGVPECTVFRAIQGSDAKYVYYGRDPCGALCQPVFRCSHASTQCNGTAEACGVDLVTGERCECAPATCDPKLSLCIKGQRCGTNACQGPCGTCTNTCGEQHVCDAAGRSSCPADCSGNNCAGTASCTACQAGCNRTTGLCNLVLQVPRTPVTGILTN
jgi:hypothetical protein